MDVLAVDAFWMGVVVWGICLLYPWLTAGGPVLAGALSPAAMAGEIDHVELLFLALG